MRQNTARKKGFYLMLSPWMQHEAAGIVWGLFSGRKKEIFFPV